MFVNPSKPFKIARFEDYNCFFVKSIEVLVIKEKCVENFLKIPEIIQKYRKFPKNSTNSEKKSIEFSKTSPKF